MTNPSHHYYAAICTVLSIEEASKIRVHSKMPGVRICSTNARSSRTFQANRRVRVRSKIPGEFGSVPKYPKGYRVRSKLPKEFGSIPNYPKSSGPFQTALDLGPFQNAPDLGPFQNAPDLGPFQNAPD
jgi:hypothetical protein